ncbi:Mur ligase family protein [Phreatobacter oligotrophus]|uniref:Mur ligase family protein n=1 Tax=Phreatobacter oligotrophus TaxID=1122261 RepID=UPI001473A6BA|nr:Mur ligase family protein [Phreatobacter oligotrophus]
MIGSVLDRDGALRRWGRLFERTLRRTLRFAGALANRRLATATSIAVTGSSAKSTTTLLLSHILKGQGSVETLVQAVDTSDIVKSVARLRRRTQYYVAELSVGRKGHLAHVVKMVQPDVAIVTFIGIEHYKEYRTRENIAAEKGLLVEALPGSGLAVLNADDDLTLAMRDRTTARTVTFGRGPDADFRATAISSRYPECLRLEVAWKGHVTPLKTRILGEHFWLPVTAAFATAIELGVPVEAAQEMIASFDPIPDRCQPFTTRAGPVFILDTWKAPWQTLGLAFDVVRQAEAKRRRIVLGMLSDYTGSPKARYRDAYRDAREAADQVIFVGDHAHRSMASQTDIETGRFVEGGSVKAVADLICQQAGADELILLKGSRNLHLERIALAFDHRVRCWEDRCGLEISCFDCGLFEHPFDEHAGLRNSRRR